MKKKIIFMETKETQEHFSTETKEEDNQILEEVEMVYLDKDYKRID